METTFHNVTIIIEADNPRAAYDKLCALLARGGKAYWESDTFSTDTDMQQQPTSELFPD